MTDTFGPALAETHSAIVFFVGDRAYKLKKPVDLGFLDFRTRAARQAICEQEVALNRRIAPDVYLGVADVHGVDGELCDHLVVMRRMPADRRLSTLVRAGEPVEDDLRHLAHVIAAFHASAERSPAADAAARAEALRRRWEDNTATLYEHHEVVDLEAVATIDRLASRYLDGRSRLFDQRIDDGRACDGHGDVLADDVFLLPDGPRVLDCIEFDPALRYGDVLADVAFLAMDLERLGRPDLARRFLDAYAEDAADVWPRSLEHHHIAYRAQVRAKVACIRAAQGNHASRHEADVLLHLARAHLEAGAVRLVLVGGLPGTGKSSVSLGLGAETGAVVLRSDEVRKDRVGLPTDQPAPSPLGRGLYAPDEVDRTYEVLLDRARIALSMGETVVIDASWSREEWREAARAVAAETASDLVELQCVAPEAVTMDRLRRRALAGGDPSDATPAVARAMAERFDEWPAATTLATDSPLDTVVAAALAHVTSAHRLAATVR